MIKATALKPVTTEKMDIVAHVLTKKSQNIKIEYSQQADLVPYAVEYHQYRLPLCLTTRLKEQRKNLHWYKHQYYCVGDCILQILFSSYLNFSYC